MPFVRQAGDKAGFVEKFRSNLATEQNSLASILSDEGSALARHSQAND
jgi:hypothetical protein